MKETKQCPYCGEEILAVAKKCKHCGEWLEPKEPEKEKKMIECPVCGEDVEEGTDICPYCHERIEGADEAIQEPKEHKVRQAQPSERQKQPQTTTEILTVSDTESKEDYGEEEEETDGLFQYYFTDVFFRHYADFKGKLSRKRFWMAYLFLLLTMMPVYCLDFALFGVPMVFYYIYTLALFVPSVAFAVRRLHDTGKSGWNLLWSLIPLVGIIIIIVMLCQKGEESTAKPNTGTKDYVLFGLIGVATALCLTIGFTTFDDKGDAAESLFNDEYTYNTDNNTYEPSAEYDPGTAYNDTETEDYTQPSEDYNEPSENHEENTDEPADTPKAASRSYATLYDLFKNGSLTELDYCDFSNPVWRDRLIKLVGMDNYQFMCDQNMVNGLEKGDMRMGKITTYSFSGWTKGTTDEGYKIFYSYHSMEDPIRDALDVTIIRNGHKQTFNDEKVY